MTAKNRPPLRWTDAFIPILQIAICWLFSISHVEQYLIIAGIAYGCGLMLILARNIRKRLLLLSDRLFVLTGFLIVLLVSVPVFNYIWRLQYPVLR